MTKVKDSCLDISLKYHTHVTNLEPKEYRVSCVKGVTTWFKQFTVLIQRSLKERKHDTFNPLRVFQVISASLLADFMWWNSDIRDTQDHLGLIFFFSIFGVFSHHSMSCLHSHKIEQFSQKNEHQECTHSHPILWLESLETPYGTYPAYFVSFDYLLDVWAKT